MVTEMKHYINTRNLAAVREPCAVSISLQDTDQVEVTEAWQLKSAFSPLCLLRYYCHLVVPAVRCSF